MHRRIIALLLIGLMVAGLLAGVRRDAPSAVAAGIGSATIAISAPAPAQPLNTPFQIQSNLTSFTPGTSTTWAGYDFELAYDAGIVKVDTVTRGLCGSPSSWANPTNTPHVITGCFLQSQTATGTLDTITLECIADGVSALNVLSRTDPNLSGTGTALFDENSADFTTTLVSSSVNCGTGGPTATATNSATPTNTPLPPTATNTPMPPTPTATPGGPAAICTTNVGGPPTLGNGLDCDTDPRFGGVLGDGWVDTEDANPHDPWDYYSVPVPALLINPSGKRDNAINPQDAQAVFAYFVAGAAAGSPQYEQDLNNNNVKDGWEYDRSEDITGALGMPDGVITARDAQAAFGMFARGVHCTSGYNMASPLCTTNVGGPPTLGSGRDCDRDLGFPGVLGDGCVDSEDANANDPWGFYSVPIPALFVHPNSLRDNVMQAQDAQAVFAYFSVNAHAGTPAYEMDANNNFVKDGWEYDRSEPAPNVLGPPDGAVTAQDAQAAFAQYKAGRRCSSGYNMKNSAP